MTVIRDYLDPWHGSLHSHIRRLTAQREVETVARNERNLRRWQSQYGLIDHLQKRLRRLLRLRQAIKDGE